MKKIDKSFIIFIFSFLIIYGLSYFLLDDGLPCYIRKITGFYCPGCGISRMFISLLKFDIYQAFRFNPLVFCLLVFVGIIAIIDIVLYYRKKEILKIGNKTYITILVLVILFGILRNIPYISFLAPTVVK